MKSFHCLLLTTLCIGTILYSCTSSQNSDSKTKYLEEVNTWHQQRIQSLKQEDSWLSLAGLYQLQEGTHTIGSDSTNDLVFPPGAPARIGTITRQDDYFSFKIASGISVRKNGTEVSEFEFSFNDQDETIEFRHDELLWFVIERRGDYYIRLKDTNHSNFATFNGIERFPVSRDWRIKATFKPFAQPQTITIPDILGDTYQDSLYGRLEFNIKGSQYSLAPLGHPKKDDEFFIIFADQTNGESTYGGGRYLYAPTPDDNNITYIDFNKAYNPPCVFTDFATCPLPPNQNNLEREITAGEKMYGN